MAASSSSESIEYRALSCFLDKLATAFRASHLTIANELVAKGVIPNDVHNKVLTTVGVGDETKVTSILKSALDQVKVCPEKYHDFVALPSFDDPCFLSLHEEITAAYGNLCASCLIMLMSLVLCCTFLLQFNYFAESLRAEVVRRKSIKDIASLALSQYQTVCLSRRVWL